MLVALLWPAAALLRGPVVARCGAAATMCAPTFETKPWRAQSFTIKNLKPLPTMEPREVVSSLMDALHRSNWDSPRPFYGFEIALGFLRALL